MPQLKFDNLAIEAKAPIDLTAAGDDGAPKQPTFVITAYNGGILRLSGFRNPVVIENVSRAFHRSRRMA